MSQPVNMAKRNLIAQWAFDTRPILRRFRLWLEDIEVERLDGSGGEEFKNEMSFSGGALERGFIMTAAVTALGTRLFGRQGEGKNLNKAGLNGIKKDADAISAYMMSEALWFLTRE